MHSFFKSALSAVVARTVRGQWLTMNNEGFIVNVKRVFIERYAYPCGWIKFLWLTIYRASSRYDNYRTIHFFFLLFLLLLMSLRETLKITFLFFSYRPTFALRGPSEFTVQLIPFSSDRRKYCKYFFKQRITLFLHTNFPIRIKYRKYNRTIILHKFIRFYKRFYSKKKINKFPSLLPVFLDRTLEGKKEREKRNPRKTCLDTTHAFLVRIDGTQFYASACLAACALRKLASPLRRVNGASNLVGATTSLRFVRIHAPVHSSNFVFFFVDNFFFLFFLPFSFPSECFDPVFSSIFFLSRVFNFLSTEF